MKKSTILLLLFLAYQLPAQLTDKWTQDFSAGGVVELVNSVSNSNGDIYVLMTVGAGISHNVKLVKFNNSGVLQWQRTYDSSIGDSEDYGVDLILDASENVYIAINVNPGDAGNATLANGYVIKKYNASGTELADRTDIANGAIKLGGVAQDLEFIDQTTDNIYVSYSINASGGMGLRAVLIRLSTGLAFQASVNYDSDIDDIPGKVYTLGSGVSMIIQSGSNILLKEWVYSFSTNATPGLEIDYNTGATISKIIDAGVLSGLTFVLTENTNGTYTLSRLNSSGAEIKTALSSVYTINRVLFDQEIHLVGSKTVSGHQELLFMRYATSLSLDFERLLNVSHGSLSSVGYDIHVNSDIRYDVGGLVIDQGTQYVGSATFTSNGTQENISPYTGTTAFTPGFMIAGSNDENIIVAASGSTVRLYAQCEAPIIDLGADLTPTEGEVITLGSTLPLGMSYSWSTGATTREIEATTDGTYTVTVTNANGCSSSDQITIDFLIPPPATDTWLPPEILVSDGINTTIRLNWQNDDPLAVRHYLSAFLPEALLYNDQPNLTGSTATLNLSTEVYELRLFPYNADDVVGPGSSLLQFTSCNYYNMANLDTYLQGLTIAGPESFTESGGTGTYSLTGITPGDEELKSFFEWTVPAGWEITEYSQSQIKVSVSENASSGLLSVKITNPCTGISTQSLSRNVYVIKDQVITFAQPSNTQVGNGSFSLGGSATSGLDITYETQPGGILDIVNGTATPIAAGTVTITATQEGNEEWAAASSIERTITVNKGDDAITFSTPADVVWDVANFNLDDLSSTVSGRQISWTPVDNEFALVTSIGVVDPRKPGTVNLIANVPADDNWNAATQVQRTLTIVKANQTITFDPLPDKLVTDEDFQWGNFIDVSSNLSASLSSSNESVVAIVGSTIQIVGAGTATITARQLGNDFYYAATQKTQSITISKLSQIITFDALPQKSTDDPDFSLTGSSTSGLGLSYSSSQPSVATVTDNLVSIVGEGSTVITASQVGDDTYAAAIDVQRILVVGQGVTTTFNNGYPQFEHLLSDTYRLLLELNEDGNVYYVVEPDGSPQPTALQIKDGKNASGLTAFKSGSVFSLVANTVNNQGQISGLPESTSYEIFLALENTSFELGPTVYSLPVTTGDFSAPNWTTNFPTMGNIASNSATVNIDLDEETGMVYYALFTSSGINRFPANLKNQSYSGTVSQGSENASSTSISLTGLQENTAYDIWLVADDEAENLQTVAVKIDFTTIDEIAPVFTSGSPSITTIDETTLGVAAQMDEPGTFYAIAQLSGETTPTFEQVKNGQNGMGLAAISFTNVDANDTDVQNLTLNNLVVNTTYDIYVAAEDQFDNPAGAPVKLSATTTDLNPPTITPENLNLVSKTDSSVTFSFSMNEEGALYYVLDPDIVTSPTVVQMKNGQTELSTTAQISGTIMVSVADQDYEIKINNLSGNTEYELFFYGEDDRTPPNGSTVALVTFSTEASSVLKEEKQAQTITFNALETASYGQTNIKLIDTTNVGLSITYTSSDTTVAKIISSSGSAEIEIVGVGETEIIASQQGNDEFESADTVKQNLTVVKASQQIAFDAVTEKVYGDNPFEITATGGASGNVIQFSTSNTDIISIDGNIVTILSAGQASINALQDGNEFYTDVTGDMEITIGKASQTINFELSGDFLVGDSLILTATASSGLDVMFDTEGPGIIEDNFLKINGEGEITVTASQPGNSNYESAPKITRTVLVNVNTISGLSEAFISVYPNPFIDQLNITGIDVKMAYIFNLKGQLIHKTAGSGPNTIDMTSIPSGVYLLKLIAENGRYFDRIINKNE